MTPFAGRVFDAMTPFVLSPWKVLQSICAPHSIDPLAIEPGELFVIVDAIADQISLVTDADNGAQAKAALLELADPGTKPRLFNLTGPS